MPRAPELDIFPDHILTGFDLIERSASEVFALKKDFSRYRDDPARFMQERIACRRITDQQKDIVSSVLAHRKTIVKSANAVGKTYIAARIAAWFFLVFPEARVWTAAAPPEDNLDRLLWGEIGNCLRQAPEAFSDCQQSFRTVSRISGRFRCAIEGQAIPKQGTAQQRKSAWSGKHAPYQLFIVDEGDGVPEEIYEAIDTCMTGGVMQRLLVLFNPREDTGILREWERSGEAKVLTLDAFSHPNVTSGEDIIPGCVTRNDTVLSLIKGSRELYDGEDAFDPALRARVFAVPEFLVGETATDNAGRETAPLVKGYRVIEESVLSYKVLARYPNSSENQLVPTDAYERARQRYDAYLRSHRRVPEQAAILGIDVAEGAEGGDFNAFVLRRGDFVEKPLLLAGLRTNAVAAYALGILRRTSVKHVCIDGIGLGAGVYSDIRDGCVTAAGETIAGMGRRRLSAVKTSERATKALIADGRKKGEFNKLRDQLLWDVGEFVKSDTSMLPPSETLRDDLLALRWGVHEATGRIVVSGKKDLRARLGRSTDELDALKMTFAPLRRAGHGKGLMMRF